MPFRKLSIAVKTKIEKEGLPRDSTPALRKSVLNNQIGERNKQMS
jgi:hypothetical protein